MNRLPPPVLLTGCARSGTSMTAGTIDICGGFGGIMSRANASNPKGMFENSRIRNEIKKPYLRGIGVDPLGQYPLPDVSKLPIPADWRKRVETVIINDGYKEGAWYYKGAKMCITWPVWNSAFPDAKWIIVRRKTPDIINSCIRTGFMRAFASQRNQRAVGAKNEYSGWLWWVHQHELRFTEMVNAGLNIKFVWPERMVSGDYDQIKEVVEWAGLTWDNRAKDFIDAKLWKSRR